MAHIVMPNRTPELDHEELLRALGFVRAAPYHEAARDALLAWRDFEGQGQGDRAERVDALLDGLNELSEAANNDPDTDLDALAARLRHAIGAAEYLGPSPEALMAWSRTVAEWDALKAPPAAKTKRGKPKKMDLSKVRVWARQNGWPDLGHRGRLPAEVVDAYNARVGA